MCEKATELTEKTAVNEMTQNQITALLDYVEVGEKLRIWCAHSFEIRKVEVSEGVSGIVVSKEPNAGPLRQITKINLKGGLFLERKEHSYSDFTNWGYGGDEKKAIVLAVTIEK